MKTTTTTAEPPRNRRPANLLERPLTARSLLASTSRGMLSFLARLSGRRRRRQRRARGGAPGTAGRAEECSRCRSRSCCSCGGPGLRRAERDEEERGRCRRSRHRRPRRERAAGDAPPRRRPRGCGRTSYIAATLLILSTGLITAAEACSSRSTPKPRPPAPTPRPNITFHMYTCPPDYAEWYCLNGATCFTVKIVDSLLYNCLCANGYIGQRCEFKDLEGSYIPKRHRVMLETASIAGAVTIAVFLAVITFISVYIHCKRKQKELRMMSNGNGVDVVDGPPRDPELRPFCSRSRSLVIFMAKNPNGAATPPIEHTRMPSNWSYAPSCPVEAAARMASVNESKRPYQ